MIVCINFVFKLKHILWLVQNNWNFMTHTDGDLQYVVIEVVFVYDRLAL